MQTSIDSNTVKALDFRKLREMTEGDNLTPLKFRDRHEVDWEEKRLGMITGSQFGELVVKTKDKKGYTLSSGKAAKTLIYRVAWERLLKSGNISNGLGRLSTTSKSMEHGEEYEQEAIQKYIEVTGNDVDYHQKFIEHDQYIGGTPDGYIGEDGLIEVKCPWNGGNHLESMIEGTIYNTDYIYQIQGYLWITGRKWCDFITYDPDLCDPLQLNIIRVERDEEIINGIATVMDEVKEKIIQIMNDKKLKINGN